MSDDRKARWLVTVTGPDRPGLVAGVADVFASMDIDLEDVTMTRLSGNFSTMLLARGGDAGALRTRLEELGQKLNLRIHVDPAVEQSGEHEPNCYVSAIGPNRTGIVAEVSAVLARNNGNILEMATCLLERTQVPVYMVRIEARIEEDKLDSIREELNVVGARLAIEVRIEPVDHTDF